MSWPQWSSGAQPAVPPVLNPATPVINSAPAVVPPGLQYTPEQWAQLQQQNWNQWAQWQQQYQQWHQQYGAEYQKSMNALAQAAQAQQQQMPTLPNVAVPPPLPVEIKPPLPTEDPPPMPYTSAPPPAPQPGYNTAPPPPKPNEHRPPVHYPKNNQNPNWQGQNYRYGPDGPSNKRGSDQGVEQEAKRPMFNKPGWQNQPPPAQHTPARPQKDNIEELSEAEKKFDKQFADWEAQFTKWKEQNAEHPDKEQYKEYEKKWESWRAQLLERREQMKRKRLGLTASSPNNNRPGPGPQNQSYNSPQQGFTQPGQQNYSQPPPQQGYHQQAKQNFNHPQQSYNQSPKALLRPGGPSSASSAAFNKPPPTLNDEPLKFKEAKPVPELDDTVGDFIKPNTGGGIPGLDLVKDEPKPPPKENDDVVVIDPEEKEKEKKGPDFDAISKGINSILGDQKLLNMLSIVSQNQIPKTVDNVTTTMSKINSNNVDSNSQQQSYPEHSNQSNEEHSNHSATFGPRELINNFDDQTRSSFTMAHNEHEMRYDVQGNVGRSQSQFPDRFGNFNKGGRFGNPENEDRDRFPPGGNTNQDRFGPHEDRFGHNQDRFGPNQDKFSANADRFGPNQDKFGPNGDRFRPNQDKFGPNADRFGPNQDKFGSNTDRFGPNQDQFGPNADRFGPNHDRFSLNQDRFGPNSDRFGPNQDRFGSNQDRFGPNQDRFGPNKDRFGPNQERFGQNQEKFGPNQERFPPQQDRFGPKDRFGSNQNRFGPDQDRFGPNQERFGPNPDRFSGTDADRFGSSPGGQPSQDRFGSGPERPQERFNGPERFGPNQDRFRANQERFGQQEDRFGANKDRFGANQEKFGPKQDRFGANQERLGPNQDRFGLPQDKFPPNQDRFGGPRNDDRFPSRNDRSLGPGSGPKEQFGFDNSNNYNQPQFDEYGRENYDDYDYDEVAANFQDTQHENVDEPSWNNDDSFKQQQFNESPVEEAPPAPAAPKPDDIFQAANVIDYDHKTLKSTEPEVLIEPIFMFDYRHKPLSRIPLPQRPRWLSDAVKNIREFEPPTVRQYEPNLRRYPPPNDNWRNDRYQDNWPPHNRRNYNESRPPFDERRSYGDNRFYDESRGGKNDWNREEKRTFNDDRNPYTEEKKQPLFQNADFDEEKISDTEWPEDDELEVQNSNVPGPDFPKFNKRESDNKVGPHKSTAVLIEDIISPPGRYKRPPRIVIILRGPPGSGKTFLAKLIKDKEVENGGSAPRILSLDDYFMVEQEKEVTEEGKKVKVKEMVYEYEEEMEESYRTSLVKSFKKTITDGYFSFIIVDNVNDKVKYFGEMWSFAKQNGFQVYICQLDLDVQTCSKRNIHGRSESDIEKSVANWEPTPAHHPVLDATSLLQSASIPEVEMEEVNSPESDLNEHDGSEDQVARSKWDNFDLSVDNLAKLDGVSKPLRHRTMEEYLQLDTEWTPIKPTKPGQKRVRWADLEEQKQQEKMRAIGFVVGHTNWDRMMDPTGGSSALTQTKYIEKTGRYKVSDQK